MKEKDKLRFKENDIFIYKSNLNHFDTLIIEDIIDEVIYKESSEALFCDTKTYVEIIYYYLNNPNEPYLEDERPFLRLSYNEDSHEISFYALYPTEHGKSTFQLEIGNSYFDDHVYYNVLYVNCYECVSEQTVYKYYYNKEFGFITYQYFNGEQYSLIEYIPSN